MITSRGFLYFIFIAKLIVLCQSLPVDLISCDFNSNVGLCNYEDTSNVTAWSIESSGTRESSAIDGPLNSETDYLQLINSNGRLQSRDLRLSGVHCISLDYYLLTSKGNISIYASRLDDWPQLNRYRRRQYYPLFNRNEKSSYLDAWQHYQKTLDFDNADYFVTIDAQTSINNTIAIKNLQIGQGPCPKINDDLKTCDFDGVVGSRGNATYVLSLNCDWFSLSDYLATSLGHSWAVLTEDDILRHQPNMWVGGSYDVSTRTSFGGFLRAAVSQNQPLEITLKTIYPQNGEHCLSFWIQQSYETQEILRWEVTETAVDTNITNVLRTNANLLIEWRFEEIKIDPVVPIVIKIRIISGVIKMDSFRLVKGKCPAPNSCHFQRGDYCGYAPYFTSKGNWFIGRGRLEKPDGHVNRQLGYEKDYYYTDFSPMERISPFDSIIVSNIVYEPGDYCFRFHFQTEHSDLIKTTVVISSIYRENINGLPIIYDHDRSTNGSWTRGMVDIKKMKSPFYVELKVDVPFRNWYTYNDLSTLKIREIAIEKKTCDQIKNHRTEIRQFGQVNFHCYSSGHYIPRYRSCDGVIDCPMGEDEGDHCVEEGCDSGIPCKRRGHRFCLKDKTQFCNSERDCEDGIDEDPRMCNEETYCDNYCLNDGVCDQASFQCVCEKRFQGKRCENALDR